jgi:hypothetical protein
MLFERRITKSAGAAWKNRLSIIADAGSEMMDDNITQSVRESYDRSRTSMLVNFSMNFKTNHSTGNFLTASPLKP